MRMRGRDKHYILALLKYFLDKIHHLEFLTSMCAKKKWIKNGIVTINNHFLICGIFRSKMQSTSWRTLWVANWLVSGLQQPKLLNLPHRLQQIEGLPFLKDFRHEYRVPHSVKVPHNKSPGYKFCWVSRLNGPFEWRQTGGSWSR